MPNASLTSSLADLPRLCADLPATGGRLKESPEDFVVDEVPLYEPEGDGQHVYLHVEKRDRNTEDVVDWLRAEGFSEIGVAGRKDRRAVTRQYISVERQRWNEEVAARAPEGVRILSAVPHRNKLRTGHLRGNRFTITVRGARVDDDMVEKILARIGKMGLPNYFGAQRFGKFGDNAEQGLRIMRNQRRAGKNKARFLVSALQSELFNRVLAARMAGETWRTVISGDVLKKVQTGGLFRTEDSLVDQPRVEAREVVPAGPLFGRDMPAAADDALAIEQAVLAEAGIEPDLWATSRFHTSGSRRALVVYPEDLRVDSGNEDSFTLSFFLPKGSYATVLLREIMGSSETLSDEADGEES